MTTPQERLRALKWGFELMSAAALDPRLDPTVRSRAQDILQIYPYHRLVAALRDGGELNLHEDFQRGLDEARAFFSDLLTEDRTPDDVKQHAVYAQRHYLTPGSWRWLSLPGAERLIGEWFELSETRPT